MAEKDPSLPRDIPDMSLPERDDKKLAPPSSVPDMTPRNVLWLSTSP